MSANKRNVTLSIDNIGDLVQESVRAYLHSGCPSGLLMRIEDGALQAAREIASKDDAAFVRDFAETLLLTLARVRKLELAKYGETSALIVDQVPRGWDSVG